MEQATAMEIRKRALPTRRCGARTRSGGSCNKSAGAGTPHLGFGRCALHGGCTRDHVKHAARQEAMEFVAGALGWEMDIDPLDATLMAVRLAAGAVGYWRHQLAETQEEGAGPTNTQIEGFRAAVLDLSRISKTSIDAGAVENLAEISEQMAEQVAAAAEAALATLRIGRVERVEFITVFTQGLRQLEGTSIESDEEKLGARRRT
jgi:hypothetical protein